MISSYTTRMVVLLWVLAPAVRAQDLEIVNIRVGQGDATLIRGPAQANGERVVVLVDAGDMPQRPGGRIVGAVLHKRGITRVDHVIATHYDADHIGGMVAGSNHGRSFILGPNGVPGALGDDDGDGEEDWVGLPRFLDPDPEELGTDDDVVVLEFIDRGDVSSPTSSAYRKYLGMATAHNNRHSLETQNDIDTFEIDLGGGARMLAVAGNGFVRNRATRVPGVNTENERSLGFLVQFGGFDYLICGDLIGRASGSENAELELAVGEYLTHEGIEVDILHVNHHGANNASEERFLAAVRPEIAIISAGNGNSHGHPHNDTLDRLVDANVYRIIQTSWGATADRIPEAVRDHQAIFQNDIVIRSDGTTYEISSARTFAVDE